MSPSQNIRQLMQITNLPQLTLERILGRNTQVISISAASKLPQLIKKFGNNLPALQSELLGADFPKAKRDGFVSQATINQLWQEFMLVELKSFFSSICFPKLSSIPNSLKRFFAICLNPSEIIEKLRDGAITRKWEPLPIFFGIIIVILLTKTI